VLRVNLKCSCLHLDSRAFILLPCFENVERMLRKALHGGARLGAYHPLCFELIGGNMCGNLLYIE